MAHGDGPIRIPIRCRTHAEDCPIESKGERCHSHYRQNHHKEYPPQAHSEIWPSLI